MFSGNTSSVVLEVAFWGLSGMTPLILAMRQLRETPDEQQVLHPR